jgi:hypothetical protein
MSKQKSWTFPLLSFLPWDQPAVVPVGTGTGDSWIPVSLQLRRPAKKLQGNETQETVLYPMSTSYNLHIQYGPTLLSLSSLLQTYPFWLWVDDMTLILHT